MKRHRTYAPPPGALAELRNPRLYGGRDEQIAGASLRSRGCPNPDRAVVYERRSTAAPAAAPRTGARSETADTPRAHARRVAKAYAAMVEAQAVVRDARMRADENARVEAVTVARELRRVYLLLSGDEPAPRALELAQASDANKIKAAA